LVTDCGDILKGMFMTALAEMIDDLVFEYADKPGLFGRLTGKTQTGTS